MSDREFENTGSNPVIRRTPLSTTSPPYEISKAMALALNTLRFIFIPLKAKPRI